ncbi:MAG: hypothetical protein HUU34_08590 [Saprospiraceae bacterium]|nr:hypothetical protein [Saprospiraceae bacterium]
MNQLTIVIFTPLQLEFEAVIRHLEGPRRSFIVDKAAYEEGFFTNAQKERYKIIVRETGMRNMEMALATEKAIAAFQPQIVFLSGIAGAIKDLNVGDVIVANKVSYSSAGKEDKDGFKARPEVYYFSESLLAQAQLTSRNNDWKSRTTDGASNARVFFGGIVADDKVIASVKNPTYNRFRKHYNDSISVDMESGGLGRVLKSHPTIHCLVVRGISDQLSNKSEADAHGSQPAAADRAAAFVFQLLYDMDPSGVIDSKGLRLTPDEKTSNLVSGKGNNDGNNIMNSTIHAKEFHQGNKITIKHTGSGDIVSGDKTIHNHGAKGLDNLIKIPEQALSEMHTLVAKARVEEALELLLDFVRKNNHPFKLEAIQLSSSWKILNSDEIKGMETSNDIRIEKSKITNRLLLLLNKMQ